MLPAWAAACFFVSGAAGLLYEVVWSKEFSLLLGNTLHAISTVVAAFLCGLAIGAWWLGGVLTRRGSGPRTYALLELGIAAIGLASVPVIRAIDPVVGALADGLGVGTAGFALARFAIVFVLLLPPTALMGATLPVLVDHFEHALVGPALAWLYAINTVGAVAGSWLGGFVLVPSIGLLRSTWMAALFNVTAGVLALVFGARRVPAPGPAADAAPAADAPVPPDAVLPQAARDTMALALAVSGFAALAFQIAWVRLFGLLLGSSVYSFAGVLGVYLAGLAIGSALVSRLFARLGSLAGFALLEALLACTAAASTWWFGRLPQAFFGMASRAGADWGGLFLSELLLVAAVILVPCVVLGAVFPLGTRLVSTGDGGRAVGRAYAVNTLGTIAGSIAAGYWLIPGLGVQGTHVAALALSALVALLVLAAAQQSRRLVPAFAVATLALLAVAGLLALRAPAWNPRLMSAGAFRPAARRYIENVTGGARDARVREAMARETVLLYREGLNGSVLVSRDTVSNSTVLRIGGKVDASENDMLTQVLSGLVPAALADSGARTLVIGQGSGLTLGAALAAGAGRTDLAELETAVIEGSRFFQRPGHDPLDDPRVRVIVEDGRTVLARGHEPYQLIVSEPSNPWLAGVNNLFTRDFYQLVRRRLAPGGVFAQWIQLYEISPETFASILGAFLSEFPHGSAWIASGRADLVLVACDTPRSLSLARLRSAPVDDMLKRAKLLGPEAVAAFWVGPLDSLKSLALPTALNTDDRPVVEYRAPRDLVEMSDLHGPKAPPAMGPVPHGQWRDAQPLFAQWSAEQWFDARVRQLARSGYFDAALRAAADARGTGRAALADRLVLAITNERAGHEIGRLLPQARKAAQDGHPEEARDLLERAAILAPGNGRVWVLLADQQRQLGQPDSAMVSLARAATVGSPEERRDAFMMAGLIEVARNRMLDAARFFTAARTTDPSSAMAWTFEARARLDGGDRNGAAAALRGGLALDPGNPQLAEIAKALDR